MTEALDLGADVLRGQARSVPGRGILPSPRPGHLCAGNHRYRPRLSCWR